VHPTSASELLVHDVVREVWPHRGMHNPGRTTDIEVVTCRNRVVGSVWGIGDDGDLIEVVTRA